MCVRCLADRATRSNRTNLIFPRPLENWAAAAAVPCRVLPCIIRCRTCVGNVDNIRPSESVTTRGSNALLLLLVGRRRNLSISTSREETRRSVSREAAASPAFRIKTTTTTVWCDTLVLHPFQQIQSFSLPSLNKKEKRKRERDYIIDQMERERERERDTLVYIDCAPATPCRPSFYVSSPPCRSALVRFIVQT